MVVRIVRPEAMLLFHCGRKKDCVLGILKIVRVSFFNAHDKLCKQLSTPSFAAADYLIVVAAWAERTNSRRTQCCKSDCCLQFTAPQLFLCHDIVVPCFSWPSVSEEEGKGSIFLARLSRMFGRSGCLVCPRASRFQVRKIPACGSRRSPPNP